MNQEGPGPLDDITVLEVANWIAAPSAGALMADMGADVIKVEPLTGDSMRGKLRQPDASDEVKAADVPFQLDNRGKRSIAVDLTDPRGRELVAGLAGRVDVFLTNLLPGRLTRYGLGAEQLRAAHPALIYGLVTGYGTEGDDADRIAFDLTAFFARGGIMSLIGEPGEPPPAFRPGQGDHATGLALLSGVLAALRVRDRTGQGQVVETALLRTAAWTIACDVSAALVDHKQPSRRGRTEAISPLNTRYRCGDGAWINIVAHDAGAWDRFCTAVDRAELLDDPRFATPVDRFRNNHQIIGILDELFASAPLEHWAPRLDKAGLIWAKVAGIDELVDDPQARAMGMFATVEHHRAGSFETLAGPFTLSHSAVGVRGAGPDVGAHTAEALAELGVDGARITELRQAGVIAP